MGKVEKRDISPYEEWLRKARKPNGQPQYADSTIKNYLESARTLISKAVSSGRLNRDPMDGYPIPSVDSDRVDYTKDDASRIILRCVSQTPEVKLPTLQQAWSGCRLGEFVDASTKDFYIDEETGAWVFHIREDNREPGQTIKGGNSSGRIVPLHPEMIRQHFLLYIEMVREKYHGGGHGPLFPWLPKDMDGRRSTKAGRLIADFIRNDLGITDKHKAPSHSWRHYVKSWLVNHSFPEKVSDALTGHKTPGVGRKYEHVEMAAKIDAVNALPNPLATELAKAA
jgi:integrase